MSAPSLPVPLAALLIASLAPPEPHTPTCASPRAYRGGCSCLAYRQEDRMDVHAAAAHPYMSFKKAPKANAAAKEAAAAAAKEAAAAGAAGS